MEMVLGIKSRYGNIRLPQDFVMVAEDEDKDKSNSEELIDDDDLTEGTITSFRKIQIVVK